MADFENFKEAMLNAPSHQLDPCMLPLIRAWDAEPKAIQVLEVLDKCIFSALASGFIIKLLEIIYDMCLKAEGTTHEALLPQAIWRRESES